jgi:hypothetical protein
MSAARSSSAMRSSPSASSIARRFASAMSRQTSAGLAAIRVASRKPLPA